MSFSFVLVYGVSYLSPERYKSELFMLSTLSKYLLLISFSIPTLAAGQVIDHHEFVGTIQLPDQSIISYKLLLDEYDDGILKGRSITDFAGSHRTESEVTGRLNDRRDRVAFKEVSNISTKSEMSAEDFCYIHMDYAEIKLSKNKSLIKGDFMSKYEDGKDCVGGTIMLMGEELFSKRLRKVTRNVKRFAPRDKKQNTLEILEDSKTSLDESLVLKDGEILTLSTYTDTISIALWDDQYIDGDKVTILVNDKPIVSEHSVTAERKSILVPLPTDTTDITILAVNQGKYPPNSSNVSLLHGETVIPVSVRLLEQKTATFRLVKQLAAKQ